MKLPAFLFLALLPAFALAEKPTVEEGFTALIPGSDLAGWKIVGGNGEFKAEDGVIIGTGKNVKGNTFLISEKLYGDFDFRFEMKFDSLDGNSGMMFRGLQREGENGRVYGYQCEHDNKKQRAWTAGLYDEDRRKWLVPGKEHSGAEFTEQGKKLIKWDDWNEIRILCEGNHLQIFLNGEPRVDFTDTDEKNATAEGFFGMQVHSGKKTDVRWRNLRIKEL